MDILTLCKYPPLWAKDRRTLFGKFKGKVPEQVLNAQLRRTAERDGRQNNGDQEDIEMETAETATTAVTEVKEDDGDVVMKSQVKRRRRARKPVAQRKRRSFRKRKE